MPAHSSDDTQMPEQPRDARDAVKAWKATTLKTIGFLDKLHMHIDKLTKDFDELKSDGTSKFNVSRIPMFFPVAQES